MGQKRSRESDMDELEFYDDGQARKKSRMGWPAQQWITIYNKHVPMKQRSALCFQEFSAFQSQMSQTRILKAA